MTQNYWRQIVSDGAVSSERRERELTSVVPSIFVISSNYCNDLICREAQEFTEPLAATEIVEITAVVSTAVPKACKHDVEERFVLRSRRG